MSESSVRLSPEQEKVIQSWGRGLAILAGAGSGKTTTLVLKCAELMKRKPEARFAAVSFTERSASDLRTKLTQRGVLGPDSTGHWVMTIHGLCAAVIAEYPREAGFDGEESMMSQAESSLIWDRAIESIWTEELQPEIQKALERLLDREGRDGTYALLQRVRDLETFGALIAMERVSDPDMQSLQSVSKFVLERYDRLKRRRGVLDFNDLERGADRALSHVQVSEAFRSRFDLVLVDEFQDTNPVQASIITRLVRQDFSNLCVVGDPKQSIYRFRDADVGVFEEFCRKLPERHSLTWNFRSRPGIIHYANEVCEDLFLASAMPYEALVPKREAIEESCVERLDVKDPSELANYLHSQWQSGVPLHEMALLLRRIRGNEKWLQALSARGIPIAVGSGGFFWEDPRVREMVSFLKWWDQPGHSFSGAVFLRAPWVGVPDTELDAWIRKSPALLMDEFFRSTHPLAKVLAPLRSHVLSPAEILSKILISDAIEDELGASYLGLWHRLEEMSSRGLDFHQVVTELSHAIQEKRRERDVPPPKNQGQIAVLTLHSSKGLEFPRVILLDFLGERRASPAPILFWDKVEGVFLCSRDSDGSRVDQDPVEARWRKSEREKDLAESKRLFYVALTRAQEKLLLVFPEAKPMTQILQKELEKDPHALLKRDHWRGWAEQTPIEPAIPPAGDPVLAAKKIEVAARFTPKGTSYLLVYRPRHSVTEWSVLSRCARAYEWQYIRPAPVGEGGEKARSFYRESSFDEGELTQRELGTRVHAALETGQESDLRALEQAAGSERVSADRILEWRQQSTLMQGNDEVWSELAFEVPVGDEVLVGSIDRLAKRGDDWVLIDFKVTQKAKSESELSEAYQTQLELYAYALSRLEPGAQSAKAYLVNLSPQKITEVEVPLKGIDPVALAKRAGAIVGGTPGEPTPSNHCFVCDFRSVCDKSLTAPNLKTK